MLKIEFSRKALKKVDSYLKTNATLSKRVYSKLQEISLNPMLFGSKRLSNNFGMYRVKVGDYRIIYSVENDMLFIWIIDHRKQAYTELKHYLSN